jgi:hypothetical protein
MTWNHTGMVLTVQVLAGVMAERPLTNSRCMIRSCLRVGTGVLHLQCRSTVGSTAYTILKHASLG